eukprot:Lankesteria_metandrocarpae@DN9951_c0_g1_i1.p1
MMDLQHVKDMLYGHERIIENLRNEISLLSSDFSQKLIGSVPTISSMATAFGSVEGKLNELNQKLDVPLISSLEQRQVKKSKTNVDASDDDNDDQLIRIELANPESSNENDADMDVNGAKTNTAITDMVYGLD